MPRGKHIPTGRRVPGYGDLPNDWFILAESPGWQEDKKLIPLIGKTGDELKRWFDGHDLPELDECYRTNVYKIWGGEDYDYTQADLDRDEPELLEELHEVKPKIIVAIGRHAARWLLGDIDLESTHGLAWYLPADSKAGQVFGLRADNRSVVEKSKVRRKANTADDGDFQQRLQQSDNKIQESVVSVSQRKMDSGTIGRDEIRPVVFVAYHPAAGFRSPEASALVSYDFNELSLFIQGKFEARHLYDDAYPNPRYEELKTQESIWTRLTLSEINSGRE